MTTTPEEPGPDKPATAPLGDPSNPGDVDPEDGPDIDTAAEPTTTDTHDLRTAAD